MNTDRLNQTLSLLANIAVLIGIIFLVVELRQANRIALRDSRADIQTTNIEVSSSVLENPELAQLDLKLQSPSPELSEVEGVQARAMAFQQFNMWTLTNISVQTGLLTDEVEESYISYAVATLDRYPGLIPFFRELFRDGGIRKGRFSRIYDVVIDTLDASPY